MSFTGRIKTNVILTAVAVAAIGGNLLSANAHEEKPKPEKLKCDGDAIVYATGYIGLSEGPTAKDALKKFLDDTYPSVDETEFTSEDTAESKPEKEKKALTKKDKKAVAYAAEEGDGFVLETFAACAETVKEEQ